ncbi:MAG: phosphoadenylyl-sulfate reductase [Chromatiaceae bacterium]|nr:MAG: phosphoadenylyl-sulfate reductase [Chromatiaceae bacterium]
MPPAPAPDDAVALTAVNDWLEQQPASARIRWALAHLPGAHVLTSSFGTQSAVLLHLLTQARPDLPVLLVDTGYLFPETYRLIDELTERLGLNLQVCRPALSPGWLEARHGRLWEQGVEGLDRYHRISKIEPMERAMRALGVATWFAGLRREQSRSRVDLPVLRRQDGRWKLHPIIDWRQRDVHRYLRHHGLPDHPLIDQGFVSVGDIHSTQVLRPGMHEEETRFFGLKRECGLHR